MMKTRGSDKLFDVMNYLMLSIVMLLVIYPIYFVLICSISDPTAIGLGKVIFFPTGINVDAYKNVFNNRDIWTGYSNSIFYTLFGTVINISVTIPCAYVLARKTLYGRKIFMSFFLFTMYFSGGLIPTYMLVNSLNLYDTRWALILPPAMSVYFMIVSRTYYQNSIPHELYEASRIDGCSNIGVFFRIAVPLSVPIIAVMSLFYGVMHWNSFFGALIYLSDAGKYPLQLVLRNILLMGKQMDVAILNAPDEQLDYFVRQAYMVETMKYAIILIACMPMLIAYPFVQKYFVKGMMIGSVKG